MTIPFICVRDLVTFPDSMQNLYLQRSASLKGVRSAETEYKKQILVASQKKYEQDEPRNKSDLFSVGMLCRLTGGIRLHDGSLRIRVLGLKKVMIKNLDFKTSLATCELIIEKSSPKKVVPLDVKARLIELFVQAKPYIIFEEDLAWIKDLMRAKSEHEFGKTLQIHLDDFNSYDPQLKPGVKILKNARSINQRNLLQQKILESKTPTERLSKIRSYLITEIKRKVRS